MFAMRHEFLFSSYLLPGTLKNAGSIEYYGNETGHAYERRGTWRLRLLTER